MLPHSRYGKGTLCVMLTLLWLAAAAALAAGEELDVERLLNVLLDDPAKNARIEAARALGEIGDPRAVSPLFLLLMNDESDFELRTAAARALGEIRHASSRDALIWALASDDRYVRRRAADGLGVLADPQTIPQLVVALRDFDDNAAQAAAGALAQIGPSSVEPVIALLNDEPYKVRARVVWVLASVGDDLCHTSLQAVAADKTQHWKVRKAAGQAVESIESRRQK